MISYNSIVLKIHATKEIPRFATSNKQLYVYISIGNIK